MKLNASIAVHFTGQMNLTEMEMRALQDLVGYGIEPFLKAFYDRLGKAYMEKHESGLRSLFAAVTEQINPQIARVDSARRAIEAAS